MRKYKSNINTTSNTHFGGNNVGVEVPQNNIPMRYKS